MAKKLLETSTDHWMFGEILDSWKCYRYVAPKRRYGISNLRCAISQKRADVTYFTMEARYHKRHITP